MKVLLQSLVAFMACFICLLNPATIFAQNKIDMSNIQDLIQANKASIGLTPDELTNYRVTDSYFDKTSGTTMVYLQQLLNDVDVHNSLMVIAFKNKKAVSVTGRFQSIASYLLNKKSVLPFITASEAVRAAMAHLDIRPFTAILPSIIKAGAARKTEFGKLGIAGENIKAGLYWILPPALKQLQLAWLVEIQPLATPDYWIIKVDALSGAIIEKINLTVYDHFILPDEAVEKKSPSFKTFQKQSVQQPAQFGETNVTTATYRVIPYPAESPIHSGGSPALQKDPWLLAGATNPATTLQWHYNGLQYFDSTRGNNVLVQEDVNANNGLGKGANSSTIQPSLLFDVAPDFTTQPTAMTNQAFAITNLFYWCNILHDISYQYGFDEQSGNFQENNLNRGGSGNDYLLADAQDGAGFNNANFTTPPDGINPRMQVFLFGGSPQKDGDLDNGIICHEYAHGITTRLTGGPSNSGCLQNAERLGEGWSDYFALMFTTNWATTLPSDGSKSRTLANYSLSQQVSGPGWRKYPYSTDMSVNPNTYADLPGTAGLIHNIGEVWASVLWDMTWEIIKLAGINPNLYDANGVGGNSVSLKLVMTGLKLQPCSPGFIDGRNAILRADTLLYNGLYSCAIWKAFAKRGMGVFAQQGRSDNYQDQVPDFTTYSFPYLTNHVDKAAASQEENITYTIKVDAPHCQSIAGFKLTDTLPAILNFISATEGTYEPAFNSVTIPNINLSAGQSKSFSITAKIKSNIYHPPVIYIEDHVDGRINAIWNTTSTSTNVWQNSSATYHSPGHSYFAKNENSQAVAILKTAGNYLLDGKGILSFWHNYNLEEGYDGAVIEISTNDGNTWQDLNPYIIKNGYNGFVDIHTTFIGGKQAYTGNSGGFIETIADLSAFTNKNILIRFVAISDESGANDGWYVDDIVLESKTAIFNSARLFDNFGNVAKRADTITLINSNTLPITLFQFYGFRLKQSNQLIWISNNDQQNLGFEIQRSDDGLSFEPLGFVQSKPSVGFGSLQVSYNYIDSFNFKQIAYYRLKLIDKDRSFAFSKIIALKNARDDAEKSITIYPNPVISVLQVSLTASQNAEYVTSIIDNTGREFWKTSRQVKVGKNLFSINVSTLTKGVCLLKINSNMSHSLKVIKFLKQ